MAGLRSTPVARMVAMLLVVAATMVAAGCGGEREAADDRALTKREYIERANGLQGDAQEVFAQLDGRLAATPATAKTYVAAFDRLIAGYGELRAPRDWRDEHDQLVESLETMRHAVLIVSRASARNRAVITAQVARFQEAQRDYQAAVQSINSSR